MSLTTWDGHARVAYVAHRRRLHISLATIERTAEADLRRGLRAAFVVEGPDGPPAAVVAELQFGFLTEDLRGLLGAPLTDAARLVIAGPDRIRSIRLDLAELDDLAIAWAPYRAVVLAQQAEPEPEAARPTLGVVAGRLWTWLGLDELRTALDSLAPAEPVLRGWDPDNPVDDSGTGGSWELPPELAMAAGVSTTLRWTAHGRRVAVEASVLAGPPNPTPTLWVCFDDGAERWRQLVLTGAGRLGATLTSSADPESVPAVLLRIGERGPT